MALIYELLDSENIILPIKIVHKILSHKQKRRADLIALYVCYCNVAIQKETERPKVTTQEMATILGWSTGKLRARKKILTKLGLVHGVRRRGPGGKILGYYVELPFLKAKTHILGQPTNNKNQAKPKSAVAKKKKEAKKKKPIYRFLNFSDYFLHEQKKNWPQLIKKITQAKIDKSAQVIHQLVRLDGFDFKKEIRPALLWALHDSFWSKNVLSPTNLRKVSKSNGETKFVNILASMHQQRGTPKKLKKENSDGSEGTKFQSIKKYV